MPVLDLISIGLIVIFILNLFLLLFILFSRASQRTSGIAFAVVILTILGWISSMFFYRLAPDQANSTMICRILYIAASLVPTSFIIFEEIFPNKKFRRNRLFTLLLILNFILFIFIIHPNLIIRNVELIPGREKIIIWGPLYILYVLFILGFFLFSFYRFYLKYRQSYGIEKIQIRFILFGAIVTSNIAFVTNLFLPWFANTYLNWMGQLATLIWVGFVVYSIVQFRFLDIRFALRAVLVKLIYITLLFTIAFVGLFVYRFLPGMVWDDRAYILTVILVIIFVFIGEPILHFITRYTDKIFFQRTYTEQEILNKLAHTMAESIDLSSLVKRIGEAFKKVFHVERVSFVIFSNEDIDFRGDKIKSYYFNYDCLLIKHLLKQPEILILDELKFTLEDLPDPRYVKQMIKEMEMVEAQVILPLHGTEKIIGMIVLGEKKSNEAFTTNDVNSLETLSYQAGIAIENAHLYSEVQSFSHNLQKEVRKATLDLREKNQFLSILRRLDQIIMNTLDLNRMCQKIVDTISWEMGYVGGLIALIDERHHVLRAMAISQTPAFEPIRVNLPKRLNSFTIPLTDQNNPLVKALAKSEEGFYGEMTDLYSPPLEKKLTRKFQQNSGIKTHIVYPLSAKGKKLGVVVLGLQKEKGKITDREKELIRAFVDQTGIALENASLYSELTKTNKELEVMNEHLKELDRMKDEFVSIASHELRTPMTAIQGYAWMLQRGKHKAIFSPRQEEYLDKIVISTERLITLVSDMLDVSRIEGGRIEIEMKKQPIEDLVISCIDEIRPRALQKNIILTYEKLKKTLPLVEIDEKKIREVLLNLLGNALKFTERAGKITVSTHQRGKFIQVNVADTGRGIAREDFPKLFKKFGRLEHSYAMISETGGTGLGLYISKALIDLHGGKIWVKSQIDNGSIFSFTVRIAR